MKISGVAYASKRTMVFWGIFVGFYLFTIPLTAHGLSPMEYFNSLVAGGDDAGYLDGDYNVARFQKPCGLALDDSSNRLFVADSENNLIRVVDLEQNNVVTTLAGTGLPGQDDGLFAKASFNFPAQLVVLPDGRIVVFDFRSQLLRMLDLKSQTVSTLTTVPKESLQIWSMIYRPQDGCLYFSEPENHRLRKLEIKSGKIATLLENSPLVPAPKALCLFRDHLFAGDRDLPDVYEVEWGTNTQNAQTPGMLSKVGKGNHIQELAACDDKIYALQAGSDAFFRIFPDPQPVKLPTALGFSVDDQNPGMEPFFRIPMDSPVGFVASSREKLKFFISRPDGYNQIISVKDYSFDKWWYVQSRLFSKEVPSDFDYPAAKPPHTFRILITGDSRVVTAPAIIPGLRSTEPGLDIQNVSVASATVGTFGKKLEFWLNADAALNGTKTRFEVLNYGWPGTALIEYANDFVPGMVRKYDVDMVLTLGGWAGYKEYFVKPVDKEGIPQFEVDREYVLRPLSSRVPPGLPKQFYESILRKGLIKDNVLPSENIFLNGGDPELKKELIQLTAKTLQIFAQRLHAIRLSNGGTPELVFFYVPWRDQEGLDVNHEVFWRDLCQQSNFTFLDLAPPFNALKTSFYPYEEQCCDHHYTSYGGHELIAYLLKRLLIEDKLIPLK